MALTTAWADKMVKANGSCSPQAFKKANLEDTAGLKMRVDFNNGELDRIMKEVNTVKGVKAFPSRGNYMLFDSKVPGKTGDGMVKHAEGKGLICPHACGPEAAWAGADIDILAPRSLIACTNP